MCEDVGRCHVGGDVGEDVGGDVDREVGLEMGEELQKLQLAQSSLHTSRN